MSTTCSRCGLPVGIEPGQCGNGAEGHSATVWEQVAIVACRDRQIAAQASLLRSVTGKLEEALEALDAYSPLRAAALIDSVLEAIS